MYSTNIDSFVVDSLHLHLTFVTVCLLSVVTHLIACNLYSLKLNFFKDLPLLLKLNLFSWTENRERGEERWLTDIVRCNLGDLLPPCKPLGDAKSSKLCDFP